MRPRRCASSSVTPPSTATGPCSSPTRASTTPPPTPSASGPGSRSAGRRTTSIRPVTPSAPTPGPSTSPATASPSRSGSSSRGLQTRRRSGTRPGWTRPRLASVSEARRPRPETRWPQAVAVGNALLLCLLLPNGAPFIPGWIVPTLCLLLLVPLVILNPRRMSRETSWSRALSIGLAVLLTLANQLTLVLTIGQLLRGSVPGAPVLLTTLQVWGTNVIAFALVYWEMDRGGPVARRTLGVKDDATMDFRFPQQEDKDEAAKWSPEFLDYAYFSLSNMMAFSPTDTMPLSARAKLLMAYQALTAFIVLALVISRAVNILT